MAADRSAKAKGGAMAAIAAVALLLSGAAGWLALGGLADAPGQASARLGAPFILIDQNGQPITERAFEGHPSLLYFGFTRCPEVCPTTLYEMAGWFDALGDEGKDIRAFFISVDPERDTPEIMKGYTDAFTNRVTGITGNPDEVFKLLKSWRVYWKKVPTEDGSYTMDHTASVFMVGDDGSFQGIISYGEAQETALQKLRNLVRNTDGEGAKVPVAGVQTH